MLPEDMREASDSDGGKLGGCGAVDPFKGP